MPRSTRSPATSPEGLAAAVGEPALDRRRFMAYLDRTADEAPAGSALANGMASRHFREAVMQGDFAAADRSAGRMRDAMLARRGFDLSDPGSCADALREGLRPAWNLASAAYSSGIHQLVGRGAPELAAAYFDLGAGAAAAWTRVCDTVDVDTWNLRELSLGHRSIALARCRPGSCLPALERLGDVLDAREPGDARRIAWWTTRTCNELIAHGHLDVEPGLLGAAEQYAEPLARSNDVDYRRAGLDALFLLGVRALNTGTPTDARRWFRACSDACGAVSDRDEHARRLAAAAQAHDAMAGGLGGTAPTRPSGASGTPR